MMQRRLAEAGFAAVVAAFGLVIVAGSLGHDTGWSPTGPGAGYVPLRVGGLLTVLAALQMVRGLRAEAAPRGEEAGSAGRVWRFFLPTAAFGLAIPWLGAYLPMAAYLLVMARWFGRQDWLPSLGVALLAPVAFWLLFETWLMVPLAKGPVEEWLGLW